MVLNKPKMKNMVINFTKKYQFVTRMKLEVTNIEKVSKVKILGTVLSDTLTWNENCKVIVKKFNTRMQLLRTAANIGASETDLKHIYFQFIRPILESSCQVWSSSLTSQNMSDLERCQNSAIKVIFKNYKNYKNSLQYFNIPTLKKRFKMLTLKFARQLKYHPKFKHFFKPNEKMHNMKLRKSKSIMKI